MAWDNNISSWDVVLSAMLDSRQVDKDLQNLAKKFRQAEKKSVEIQAKINFSDSDSDIKKFKQQQQKYVDIMNDTQKQIMSVVSRNPDKYLTGNSKRYRDAVRRETAEITKETQKEEAKQQKIIQQSEAEQQRIIQQSVKQKLQTNKEYYNQLARIRKQLDSENISDTDKQALLSQQASLRGTVGSNTKYINTYGTASQQEQNKALAQAYQTNRLIEQSQENQRRKAQEIKNAYNDVLLTLKQISTNTKEINQLESKKHLNTEEKDRLATLKQQTDELQEQYSAKMKIVSQDANLKRRAEQITKEYQQQTNEVKKQNSGLQTTNKHSKTLGETIKNIGRYVVMYQALNAIQTGMTKAYETISDLDKAFTDIQLVTGDTDEQIQQLSQDYNELAKVMGATTQQVAEGASEWLRQGKSIEETNYLLKSSMTLSKVGAMESAEATELLTSTLNGYKFEAEEAMNVVDKVSAIDMAAATSSEELMTALSRTANSADDAGVSFDKLLAMIGTVSSVTRKSASTIGESFKTIFSRLSNVAAGKDIDDEGESLNDVETSLNKIGIALRSSQNEWRNFEDVLDEVADKWTTLDSTQQSQVATAIAGTRQQENFRALMNNWDQVTDLVGIAAGSTGTATERMGIYLDSVEAKTNQLKASWEGFIMSLQQTEGFKWGLDFLANLLEDLEHVDWQLTGIIGTVGMVITLLPKVVSGIKAIKAAIKAGTGLASIFSGGTVTAILAIISAIATIVTMISSANVDLDKQLEDIQDSKAALEEEKKSVQDLYAEYSKLESKKTYYSLTADEKQRLSDITKTLVEQYGFEAEGVDALTGSYQLATDAMQKYLESVEREKRLLTEEERQTLVKSAKEDVNDWRTERYSNNVSSRFGKAETAEQRSELLDAMRERRKTSNPIFGITSGDVGEEVLEKYGRNNSDRIRELNDYLMEKSEEFFGSIDYSKLSDDQFELLKDSITQDIMKNENAVVAKAKEVAEDLSKIISSDLGEEAPQELVDIVSNSISTALSDENNPIDNAEDFINKFTTEFTNMISGQEDELTKVLSRYNELQQKANLGTLSAGEYKEYEDTLRVYIELIRQAGQAAGMSEEQINSFIKESTVDATNNLNVQLLELQENMNKSSEFAEVQKSRFNTFSNQLLSLNSQFKEGKISAQDYYNQLNQLVNNIDPTNIQQITDTFGNLNNYLTTMGSVFQDTTKYLDSIWMSFQGGGDSLEFLNNFLPAAQQLQSLAGSMIKLDEASSAIDLDTREDNTADIDMSVEDIQREIKTRYEVDVNTEDIDKAKEVINELDGKDVQVYIDEQGADNLEDGFENVLNYVDDITDGSAELTDSVGELGSALGDLANLDFNSVDSAFETLSKAFDDLPEGATSLVGTTDAAVQQAAQSMANWMVDVANQGKEYSNIASQYLIETSNAAGAAITDISQVNSNIIAQALMTDAANVNNFAVNANKIAQLAMSTAVQKLGEVLSAMGSAIANLNVEIPISLDGIADSLKIGPLDIPIEIPNIQTTLKIGGEGTKGLSGIGDALKGLGDTLQDPAVSNTIASQFTPVQANYTPTPTDNPTKGSPGSYKPSSGGSGGGGSDDAAEEAAKLAEDIAAFREDEGTALEDITEELINHYRLEKTRLELQKENLDYANDLLDAEENTTQWIKVQNQLLTNQRKQIQELYRTNSKIEQQMAKIQSENSQYNIDSWFDEAGNDTLEYINLINSFAQQERDYRATVSLNSQEDIENAEKYIEQLQKQRDYVENLHDSVSQLKEAWIDNGNELQDLFSEMNDTLKEMRDTLLDKFMTALEDRVDEVNQAYEDNIDRLDSLITVQERYNDVINSSLDTQAELRKELQSNKDSYQYLDDYMRSIIFNEDDYKELSKELDKVMSDMNALSDEYQYKINNLTEDEMYMLDEITNEYERQVDLKEKEYEILQAQLDVVKARTQLENARNERTVRMFVGNEWVWTADPEEIKSANEELADAQAEVERLEREKEQEELLHQMEAEQDKNQMAIDKNEQLLEQIQDRVDEITTETKSIEEWLELIATEGPPMLHDIFADIGTKLEELMNDLGNDSSKVDAAGQNTTEAIKQGLLNGTLDPDQWAEKIGWIKGDNGKWYAPMDDPYYDPAGFDFGKANVDTSSTTDKSGVQIQGQGEVAVNNQNQQTSTGFPRQGSLRNVSSVLNIRSGAGMDYGIIGKIPPSGKPQVLGENGNWAQVNYNGITGWASKDYLTYDKGGLLKGKGVALKDTLKPEAILSPEQTKAWTKLVDNLTNPMLAQLTTTPTPQKVDNNTEKYIGDTYTFNNVTVKADDIDQFITSIKGWVPIS